MKFEIKKALTPVGDKIWHEVYVDDKFKLGKFDLEDAKKEIENIKFLANFKPEIVYTEEYEPSQDNQNPA